MPLRFFSLSLGRGRRRVIVATPFEFIHCVSRKEWRDDGVGEGEGRTWRRLQGGKGERRRTRKRKREMKAFSTVGRAKEDLPTGRRKTHLGDVADIAVAAAVAAAAAAAAAVVVAGVRDRVIAADGRKEIALAVVRVKSCHVKKEGRGG